MLPLLLGLSGCPDPQGAFDDFADRWKWTHDAASGGGVGGDGGVCDLPDPSALGGEFVLVISTSLDPKVPIVLLDDVTAASAGTDQIDVGMTLTALSANDRKTEVGAPLGPFSKPLAAGHFSFDFGALEIVGEADPLMPGAAIKSTLILDGELCAAPEGDRIDFLCGTADGEVTLPLPLGLAGSTWTLARIGANGEFPELSINCAKEPPNAL